MKICKKILIIWDLDGFIGAVNSSYPYNYSFNYVYEELDMVRLALSIMKKNNVKSTFAVTGFSAEDGIYPYVFPDLIKTIYLDQHEIASHSWRHEWIPLFKKDQIVKSLRRSKSSLSNVIGGSAVTGFVPPHNKPSSWLQKGAFSPEDRGLFPFFKLGNMPSLLRILKDEGFNWIRISYNPFWRKIFKRKIRPQKVYKKNWLLIFENHYMGFDKKIQDHILRSNSTYFVVSAHPVMLRSSNCKKESLDNFKSFIDRFSGKEGYKFVRPLDIIDNFS